MVVKIFCRFCRDFLCNCEIPNTKIEEAWIIACPECEKKLLVSFEKDMRVYYSRLKDSAEIAPPLRTMIGNMVRRPTRQKP